MFMHSYLFFFFFFNDTATTEIYTLSLHDALPIYLSVFLLDEGASVAGVFTQNRFCAAPVQKRFCVNRSEEHTSELQSQSNLVCRLLLEKKKKKKPTTDALITYHLPVDSNSRTHLS